MKEFCLYWSAWQGWVLNADRTFQRQKHVFLKKREAVSLKLRARKGFTLMEIMVVLAVIALLTATLYPSYALARQRANVSTLLSSSPKVLQYLELYRIDHQLYPTGNVVLDESQTGTDMLKAYYERSTPWPWDKEKKLENFFAYSSEETPAGSIFYICWPVDKSAIRRQRPWQRLRA